MRDLGYNEGRNIKIGYRFADGAPERYPALMAELIAFNPVLIVVGSTPAIVAASKVTRTTPFARPGRNATGVTFLLDELASKRLEIPAG